jgi:hypothetical protein
MRAECDNGTDHTVLVAADDFRILLLAQAVLAGTGYRVLVASTAPSAVGPSRAEPSSHSFHSHPSRHRRSRGSAVPGSPAGSQAMDLSGRCRRSERSAGRDRFRTRLGKRRQPNCESSPRLRSSSAGFPVRPFCGPNRQSGLWEQQHSRPLLGPSGPRLPHAGRRGGGAGRMDRCAWNSTIVPATGAKRTQSLGGE